MYDVLVPVDRDANRTVHQAKYVASLPDATEEVTATVLFVVPPDEFVGSGEVEFSEIEAAVEAADFLESEGIDVRRLVGDGGIADQIVNSADELDVDEVVMGGRKRSGVSKVLLGSVTQDVMLSADRPVTITGEEVVIDGEIDRVLVPVDENVERARHQAAYVAGLPGSDQMETTVFHVFEHQDYKGAPPHEFEEVDAAVEAADYLETEGIAVERVITGGELSQTILEAADQYDVDALVLGGRKRSGVTKVLLGSTSLDLILSAERPVTITG